MSIIGYKTATSSDNRVIITLLIPPDALTNMSRHSIAVKENASYRCNKALVLKIEDDEGNQYQTATSLFSKKVLIYELGCMVEEPSFNTDLERVHAEGIFFFLNKRVAELYNIKELINGNFESWYPNGNKHIEFIHEKNRYCSFFDNGKKEFEILYKDNAADGIYKEWNYNGSKKLEIPYENYEVLIKQF